MPRGWSGFGTQLARFQVTSPSKNMAQERRCRRRSPGNSVLWRPLLRPALPPDEDWQLCPPHVNAALRAREVTFDMVGVRFDLMGHALPWRGWVAGSTRRGDTHPACAIAAHPAGPSPHPGKNAWRSKAWTCKARSATPGPSRRPER